MKIETKCVQAGYTPGNGEPREVPIYQSTTFKYSTSEEMGKLFDLEANGYSGYTIHFDEFGADGRVNGTDGCNRLFGGWSIQGTRITLTDMASTKMYCHDVDEWLSAGAAADVDGDTLRILDSSGTEIGTLRR